MRVVHVVDDLSPANTGITAAVKELSRAGVAAGWSVEIVSVGHGADWGLHTVRPRSAPIEGRGLIAAWRYAPMFGEVLRSAVGDGALVHIHGMWFYPQWRAASTAIRYRWPMLLSPHNMLGGWLWRRGRLRRLKKAVYFNAVVKAPFSGARAVHALSDNESARIAQFLSGPKRVTIPNALDLGVVDSEIKSGLRATMGDDRYVLFLGRIHPVKNLEAVIEGTAQVEGLRLVIAGPSEDLGYEGRLRAQVRALGLQNRVSFVGAVSGAEKWRLVTGAWVLCTPSHSEGMGMVALEAMAAGVPVITTPAAGFTELDSAGGMLVQVDASEVAKALTVASAWSGQERARRGALARAAVEEKYSWPKVWPLYEQLYRSAAG